MVSSITLRSNGKPVTAANVNGGDLITLWGSFFGPVPYAGIVPLLQSVTYGATGSEFSVPATSWMWTASAVGSVGWRGSQDG